MTADTQFLDLPDARRIAYRHHAGHGPMLVFLPGYMSDMDGSKATALAEWARAQGRACLLLDYSGCGQSEGDFADGTLSRWCEEVLVAINHFGAERVLLVGSSMGGWLMLMAGAALGRRLHAMVGIAAAPDFTEWGFDEGRRRSLQAGETVFEENPYGPEPTPTHAGFWRDGQERLQLGDRIPVTCPVRLLHGQDDADVPSEISLRLAAALASDDVRVTLVKGGDHRLSGERDIALLLRTLEELVA